MRKAIALILSITALFCVCTRAQTNTLLSAVNQYTNVLVVPYFKYDFNSHKTGYGGAALYKVTDNFLTGFRYDHINGFNSSAGVQAQLQMTVQVFNMFTAVPFLEASTGLGSSTTYASGGPGIAIILLDRKFRISGHEVEMHLDIVADYEHVVQSGSASANSNQGNIGPGLRFMF